MKEKGWGRVSSDGKLSSLRGVYAKPFVHPDSGDVKTVATEDYNSVIGILKGGIGHYAKAGKKGKKEAGVLSVLSQGIAFDGVMKVLHEIPFENDA